MTTKNLNLILATSILAVGLLFSGRTCLPQEIRDSPKRCYWYQEIGLSRYEDSNIIAYHECFDGRDLAYTDRNKDGKIEGVSINLGINNEWNSNWEKLQRFAQDRVDKFNSEHKK